MENVSGFSFINYQRNKRIEEEVKRECEFLTAKKTGTTIAGVLFKDGIVLGADTRSTMGAIVGSKVCEKIHRITDNISCCGAGTAADTDNITKMMSMNAILFEEEYKRKILVKSIINRLSKKLFQYQGYLGAALILGGIDSEGKTLCSIHPHGSIAYGPYQTMGSGCLASMAVLETKYRDNMTKEEAMELVADAIESGVSNDLGSGSNVNICVITSEGTQYYKNYRIVASKLNSKSLPIPEIGSNIIKKEVVILRN